MIVASVPSRPMGAGEVAEYFLNKRAALVPPGHHHPLTWCQSLPKPRAVVAPDTEHHAKNCATFSLSENVTTPAVECMAHTPGAHTRVHRIQG